MEKEKKPRNFDWNVIFKIYSFIKKIKLIRKITPLFFEIQLNRNNILNSYFNDFTVNW